MNQRIRKQVRQVMVERLLTQEAIAELSGIKQTTVSRLLTGTLGKAGAWEKLLDGLGLELVAVPKGTDVSKLLKGE